MNLNYISVIRISQLKDNYSYIIKDNKKNLAIIIDPAESTSLINYIDKNKIKLISILLTHHHSDHTAGVNDLLAHSNVPVYSPSKKIDGTTNIVQDNEIIELNFLTMKVISTPGHTLDHVIYYNDKNNLLFSGDTLFRLGCGRVFEGTFEIMHESLNKIKSLNNDTEVYCGHEYTINNLNFLLSLFPNFKELQLEKKKIDKQILKNGSSIPFNLGNEKMINPFLSSESLFYQDFMKKTKLKNFEMFSYLRELKDKF
tara:strand:- start:1319 stop:2086 length:768 start_codon:yes stop_codon:yes gene_type:complete